ncbi:hypothetical protein KI387_018545, partial [Taxus chinensis]
DLYPFTHDENGGGIRATTLLHVWEYENIVVLRPVGGQQEEWARPEIYTRRWINIRGCMIDTNTSREFIDKMGPETITWKPYRDYGEWPEDSIEL